MKRALEFPKKSLEQENPKQEQQKQEPVLIFLSDVTNAIASCREQFQREQIQAIRKRSIEEASWSLAQCDAADQIESAIRRYSKWTEQSLEPSRNRQA